MRTCSVPGCSNQRASEFRRLCRGPHTPEEVGQYGGKFDRLNFLARIHLAQAATERAAGDPDDVQGPGDA